MGFYFQTTFTNYITLNHIYKSSLIGSLKKSPDLKTLYFLQKDETSYRIWMQHLFNTLYMLSYTDGM